MGDRELLELAARAAGFPVKWHDSGIYGPTMEIMECEAGGPPWNPLTDDGDALRLAARLRLQINPGKHLGDGCTVETQRDGIAGCTAFYDDKAEQMRQAIVRAAAEIGRRMP